MYDVVLNKQLQDVRVVPKDGEVPIEPSPQILTGDLVEAIRSGSSSYAVIGYATYDDIFGGHRKTTFCTYYDRFQFNMIFCPGYNTAE